MIDRNTWDMINGWIGRLAYSIMHLPKSLFLSRLFYSPSATNFQFSEIKIINNIIEQGLWYSPHILWSESQSGVLLNKRSSSSVKREM